MSEKDRISRGGKGDKGVTGGERFEIYLDRGASRRDWYLYRQISPKANAKRSLWDPD